MDWWWVCVCVSCFSVLQAPCCGKLYVCRLCHDAVENHQMDRFKVKDVQCSECHTLQQVREDSTSTAEEVSNLTTVILFPFANTFVYLLWFLFHSFRHNKLASSVMCSLGSITATFVICLTRIRNSTTVSLVGYAGEWEHCHFFLVSFHCWLKVRSYLL